MLRVENISVSYGAITALRGVSLEIAEGEIFSLIGPNGAGKSTLVNAVSGIVACSEGRITFEHTLLSDRAAHLRARDGIIQVPEGRRVIAPLTVEENLELGQQAAGKRGAKSDLQRVFDLFPVLSERRRQLAGLLSGGQQQMLAIGRALMGHPRILLLDEPSLGLAPVLVKEVFETLKRLNKEGLTILLVEQNARLALEVANNAAIIEQGRIVHRGAAASLAADPRVADHYFGRSEASLIPATA
jgi:branched-chain amino acid transport system ATP-binding protein